MELLHTGTVLSFSAELLVDGRTISIKLSDGQEISWKVKGRRKMNTFCPSVEGDIIVCFSRNKQCQYYDTKSGQLLTEKELRARNPHFYK